MSKFTLISRFSLLAFVASALLTGCEKAPKSKSTITVGVVVPMDHMALREIVSGLESTLQKERGQTIQVKVKNAQGDMQMQRVIIQQMIQEKVDVIAPIGLAASQMSAQMSQEIPIVCLAARLGADDQRANVTGINDEIECGDQLRFIRQLFPEIQKLTLIHSPSEKIFPEVQQMRQLCQASGIQVQTLMIQALSDLYPIAQAIDRDSELIFVLKDHMVVSGMSTLAQVAEKLKIALMASDEGSVEQGAAFALGVREREIGEQGGELIMQLLDHSERKLPAAQTIKNLHLFMNSESCRQEGLDSEAIKRAARQQHIDTEEVS